MVNEPLRVSSASHPATVYAHRGWHDVTVPENSLSAFARAAAAGVGIETDLRTTRDGRLILFHDRTAGDAAVDTLTHSELEIATGRHVPLLDELLDAALPVPLNLEVKTRAAWVALRPRLGGLPADVLISSFIHDIAVAAAADGLNAALLLASLPAGPALLPTATPLLHTAVWDFNIMEPDLPARARAAGWRTIVYGPRGVAEHRALVAAGVGAIITDTPDRALAAVGAT